MTSSVAPRRAHGGVQNAARLPLHGTGVAGRTSVPRILPGKASETCHEVQRAVDAALPLRMSFITVARQSARPPPRRSWRAGRKMHVLQCMAEGDSEAEAQSSGQSEVSNSQ